MKMGVVSGGGEGGGGGKALRRGETRSSGALPLLFLALGARGEKKFPSPFGGGGIGGVGGQKALPTCLQPPPSTRPQKLWATHRGRGGKPPPPVRAVCACHVRARRVSVVWRACACVCCASMLFSCRCVVCVRWCVVCVCYGSVCVWCVRVCVFVCVLCVAWCVASVCECVRCGVAVVPGASCVCCAPTRVNVSGAVCLCAGAACACSAV